MLAIVPVKSLNGAKSRLAPAFPPGARADLVRAMLARVLAACAEAESVAATLVVTPEPEAVPAGVGVLLDDGRGHAAAIALALKDPRAAAGALVVMADLPLARGASLDGLVAAAHPAALAPARDGGLNAFAFRGACPFEPAFGLADAAAVTAERARAAGIEPAVVEDPCLALDLDRPSDISGLALAR